MDTHNQTNTPDTSATTPVSEAPVVAESTPLTPETPPVEATPEVVAPSKKPLYIIAGIIVAGALIAGGYYHYVTRMADGGPVAVVNGFKIARQEFNDSVAMITQTASLQGADVTDPAVQTEINNQAIDTLVSNTLLVEGAKSAGFTADEAAIQTEYDSLITQLGGEEELIARMEEVGLTEEKLRNNISDRLIVDAFLEAETDIEVASATEEEVQALYDSYKSGGVEIPPFEDVKVQLESQITAQKRQEMVDQFLTSLKESAQIEIKI